MQRVNKKNNRQHRKLTKLILWNMNYILDAQMPNVGDKALLTTIINSLKKINLNLQIIVFSSDEKIINREFGVIGLQYRPYNIFKIIKTIWESDIFIFAGGEVINDRGSSLYTPFMLHAAILAKLMKKRIMGYAIGVGDLSEISPISKLLSKIVFKNSVVTVRDDKSKSTLINICAPKKIYITADPAINLEPSSCNKINQVLINLGLNKNKKPLIAIVPRQPLMPLKGFRDYIYNILPMKIREKLKLTPNDFDIKLSHFQKKIAKIADYLVKTFNAQIIFISMFNGFMSYKDDILCKNIINEMQYKSFARLICNTYSASLIKGIFGKTHLVIGIPLHSIIFASSLHVPIIAFSYESKVYRYMTMIGCEKFCFNLNDINQEINLCDIYKTIDYIMENREEIVYIIKQKMDNLKKIELNNINILLSEIRRLTNDKF